MQAMTVRRLSDSPMNARLYLDGKRVTRAAYDLAHFDRTTNSYSSRITRRKRDGAEMVREYHCIRVKQL